MKAIQYWALLKYLPVAIGSDVPSDNKHWQFLRTTAVSEQVWNRAMN